jgi:hypothetical protein
MPAIFPRSDLSLVNKLADDVRCCAIDTLVQAIQESLGFSNQDLLL